jgi:hypothetical protein
MKKQCFGFLVVVICLSYLTGCGSQEPLASLHNPQGKVQTKENSAASFKAAQNQESMRDGSAVKTGEDGETGLIFPGKGELSLKPNSYFDVKKGDFLGLQTQGRVMYKIQKQGEKAIQIQTPHGVTAVLGTQFLIDVNATSTAVVVSEGKVRFSTISGEQTLEIGQRVIVGTDGKVPPPEMLSPLDLESLFSGGV